MEIQSGGEKMRNASGQQGENEKQCVTRKFDVLVVQNSVVVVQNNGKGKTKKRPARANLLFANQK